MNILDVSGVSGKQGKNLVLKTTSFKQAKLEKIAIAGETGSGKTTLLKIIGGLITPDEGEVWFKKERLKKVPAEKLIPGHPGIAYLSQHFELRNNYRVEEILSYANELGGVNAAALYKVCRIDHLLQRRTDQLSGGEKQRIALARLLVSSPGLLLLDEPFSNLDMIHKGILKSVIHDIGEQLQITCILVSHDPQDCLSWAHRIMVMKEGGIIQQGSPLDIYQQPADLYTAALFGKYSLIDKPEIFSIPPDKKMHGKKLFARPEYFTIVKGKNNGTDGTVQSVAFFGSYYEFKIILKDKTSLIMHSLVGNVEKGEKVNLALSTGNLWYL